MPAGFRTKAHTKEIYFTFSFFLPILAALVELTFLRPA